MRGIYITGTDTGVGKTLVTGLLGRYMLDRGRSVITQKWVETGTAGFSRDLSVHLNIMGVRRRDVEKLIPLMSPYRFKFASSPHLAAALEGRRIRRSRIIACFNALAGGFDRVLVEGAGGALVPYGDGRLMIDIAKELGLAVLIVCENRLGAINHTLLTLEAVERRGMRIIGIVFNDPRPGTDRKIAGDNIETIKKISGIKKAAALPYLRSARALKKCQDIFDGIFA